MQINVSQILGRKGAVLPFELSEAMQSTKGYPDVVDFLEPVKLEGTLTYMDNSIMLEGKGIAILQLPCDRCLMPVSVKVHFKLSEKFNSTGSKEEETELFNGDCIELDQVVKRNLLASLPMKILCRQDCKGLCSICGKDLNEGDCNCDTTYINPKFESLRSLFKVDEEV